MTAGTGVIMWLGELITDRGVGNGMSVLMFTSIAARIPNEGQTILQNAGGFVFTLILALGLAIIARGRVRRAGPAAHPGAVREADDRPTAVRRHVDLPAAEGEPGRCHPGHLRLVAALHPAADQPAAIQQLDVGFQRWVNNYLINQQSWVYITIYFVLIIFFAYFYVSITFNPDERADDMKKYGGFIPGIRPGRPTAEYLQFVLSRITLPGSLYLGIIAVLPNFFFCDHRRQQPELPVRRYRSADHGRRGLGHREADREPADAAQLRRVPALARSN